MAVTFLNSTETPLNFSKFKKSTKTSTNLKSLWASLLSIFVYMSAFYVFNLSPSSLLSTTKFWFFISNTLILIIAADFGAFSSSKEHDLYEEYTRNSIQAKSVVPSFKARYNNILDQPLPDREHAKETEQKPNQKILDTVEPDQVRSYKIQENNKPQLLSIKEEEEEEEDDAEDQNEVSERIKKGNIFVHPEAEKKRKWKCARRNSDKGILMLAAAEEENREKMVLQRTLSEKHEEPSYEDNNEFASMSNEEVNRRVEEFILKCNRQIRLQAVRSRRQDEGYLQGQNGEIESPTRLSLNT